MSDADSKRHYCKEPVKRKGPGIPLVTANAARFIN
jgi:hypothetical protein